MKKTPYDDGFHQYLVEGAIFVGEAGIPMLMDLDNVQVPKEIAPFDKARAGKASKKSYIHFYMHDKYFAPVLSATDKYLDLFKKYDGAITPDCTMLIGQSKCLQETNTYLNRAVGFYLQKQGIPVIPNIRWSDERSFEYCFLGVPKHYIVSISTHGCIRSMQQKECFKSGLYAMLENLEPKDVLVHGYMPDTVFGEFAEYTNFHRYPSVFEQTHGKG